MSLQKRFPTPDPPRPLVPATRLGAGRGGQPKPLLELIWRGCEELLLFHIIPLQAETCFRVGVFQVFACRGRRAYGRDARLLRPPSPSCFFGRLGVDDLLVHPWLELFFWGRSYVQELYASEGFSISILSQKNQNVFYLFILILSCILAFSFSSKSTMVFFESRDI